MARMVVVFGLLEVTLWVHAHGVYRLSRCRLGLEHPYPAQSSGINEHYHGILCWPNLAQPPNDLNWPVSKDRRRIYSIGIERLLCYFLGLLYLALLITLKHAHPWVCQHVGHRRSTCRLHIGYQSSVLGRQSYIQRRCALQTLTQSQTS